MAYAFDHLNLIKEITAIPPLGLITDIDGTISEIASTPDAAQVSPECRHYLTLLHSQLALVAAVSGRAADTIKDMVNISGMVYVGNHETPTTKLGRVRRKQP